MRRRGVDYGPDYETGLADGDYGDIGDLYDDEGMGGTNVPQPTESAGSPYQINIPDWLSTMAEEGYNREWERAKYGLAGEAIGTQTVVARRRLGEMGYRTGVSKSGFVARRLREINFEKQKALAKLKQAISEQDEQAKLRALDTLKSIQVENEALKEQWNLMSAQERLAAQQRGWAWNQFLEQRRIQQKAEEREWWQSILGGAASALPWLVGLL